MDLLYDDGRLVLVLRRKWPDAHRPYRMWGYPYTLWVFVAASVWFMADALVTQTQPSLMAFVIVALGILAYQIRFLGRAGPASSLAAGTGPRKPL